MESESLNIQKDFASVLYSNIKERFKNNEIMATFKIFSVNQILACELENIASYGREEIDLLILHYGVKACNE